MTDRHLVAAGIAALVLGAAGLLSLSSRSRTAPPDSAPVATTSAHAAPPSVRAAPPAAPAVAVDAESAAQFSVVAAGATNPRGRVDWERADVGAARSLVQSTELDPSGVARTSLPAGRYRAVVRVGGFAATTAELSAPPKGSASARVQLEPGVALSGRVVNSDGSAAAHASVRITPGELDWVEPDWTAEATTDESGRFAVSDLSVGEARIVARAPGFGTAQLRVHLPHAEPIELRLVAVASIRGVVKDASGSPAADATVTFRREADVVRESAGPNGAFAAELPAGTWTVSAEKSGAFALLARKVVAPAGTTHEVELVLGAGGVVAGLVKTRDGKPVAGAQVALQSMWMQDLARTATDETGHFASPPVTPGRYFVVARADGYPDSHPGDAAVEAGGRVDVVLVVPEAATLKGYVVDASGAPVAGASVRAWESYSTLPLPVPLTTSDARGAFELRGLAQSDYLVRAEADDGRVAAERVKVDPGAADVRLVVGAPGVVEGLVVGAPKGERLFVRAGLQLGSGHFRVTVDPRVVAADAEGRFRFALPDGQWELSIEHRVRFNHTYASLVKVEAGKTARVELDFEGADETRDKVKLVAGTLLDASGQPAGSASLEARAADTGSLDDDLDPNGHFEIWGPAGTRGPVALTARNGGQGASLEGVAVGRDDVVLQLSAGRTLHVHLRGASATTSADLTLSSRNHGPLFTTQTLSVSGMELDVPDAADSELALYVATADGRVAATAVPAGNDDRDVDLTLVTPARLRWRSPWNLKLVGPTPDPQTIGGAAKFEHVASKLAPGTYALALSYPEKTLRTFELREGEDRDLGAIREDESRPRGLIGTLLLKETSLGVVIDPMENGPAAAAGMQKEDIVTAADGRPVRTFDDCARLVAGEPNTTVTLDVLRGGQHLTFVVRRAE